jgi:hypothetical protein
VRRALTLAAATVSLAALLSPAVASASTQRQVLTLKLVATNTWNVDNDPGGPSGGDLFGSSGDLRRRGHRLGTYSSACTASSAVTAQCAATLVFSNGVDRLQLAGQLSFEELPNHYAIVGGTGKYRRARGEATVAPVDQSDPTRQRVRLVILR